MTVKSLVGAVIVLALVSIACYAVSTLQPSVVAPRATHPTTHPTTMASATATALPQVWVAVVNVSYTAGHAEQDTATVEVTATLWWGALAPQPYKCGTFTLAFSGYNRPREITCRLSLPAAATGVPAHGYQSCQTFTDANHTIVCWDNPKAFQRNA